MARTIWFVDKGEDPLIHERMGKLGSSPSALGGGHVSKQELGGQEQRLFAAMKALEPDLSDALHARVTTVLVELSAYNVMRLLHELRAEQTRLAFKQP